MSRINVKFTTRTRFNGEDVEPGDNAVVDKRTADRWQRNNIAEILEDTQTEKSEKHKTDEKLKGSPNDEWTKKDLLEYAKENEIEASENMTKGEILKLLEGGE